MKPEVLLFLLRLFIGLCLYAFLAAILYYLRKDLLSIHESDIPLNGCLVVLKGPEKDSSVVLAQVNLIGRANDNTICIKDSTVSSYHARISSMKGQWILEDLGSHNGTHINDIIVRKPMALAYGDTIHLGKVQLKLVAIANPISSAEPKPKPGRPYSPPPSNRSEPDSDSPLKSQ